MLDHPVVLGEVGRQRHMDDLKAADNRRLIKQLRSEQTSVLKQAFQRLKSSFNNTGTKMKVPQTSAEPKVLNWAKE
jgi:hypothetical protein